MALSKHVMYKINENTENHTTFCDAAEPYKVFPKLRVEGIIELQEVDFFGGYRIPSDPFTPSSSNVNREQVDQRGKFIRQRVQLSIVLKEFKSGHICFIGPAGMGKSSLMRLIARRVLSKEFEGLEEIEIVHFVQCRHYEPDALLTIGEFLFGAELDKEEVEIVMKFAILHPNKILFILDSLDTLRFSDDGVYKYITADEQVGPGAILWNFLSGRVLENCRIITSGREHSIRNFMGEVRPQKVISLLGFMEETIEKVIAEYVGKEKANQIFAHMKEKLPDMLNLCSIPVILVYTLIGLQAESDLKPTTMTRIMVIVLQSIMRSPHMLQYDVLGTMYKLEELAHLGNIAKRLLFFLDDFKKVGLEPEMATDLAVIAPGGLPDKLMRGGTVMFYTHQMVQEMLGALWIGGGDLDVLKNFIKSCINAPYFGVIRRFLCGILLDREVYEAVSDELLPAVPDIDHKKSLLLESLSAELKQLQYNKRKTGNREKYLELLIDLNESKDTQLIRSSVKEIDLFGVSLSQSDVQAVSTVMKQSEYLNLVNFHNSNLTEEKMAILDRTLLQSSLKFKEFHVGENMKLGPDVFHRLGRLVRDHKVEVLMVDCCSVGSEHILKLSRGLGEAKFKEFDAGVNEELGPDGFHSLGKLVHDHEVKVLRVERCHAGSEHIQKLSQGLGEATVLYLYPTPGNFIGAFIVTTRAIQVVILYMALVGVKTLNSRYLGIWRGKLNRSRIVLALGARHNLTNER